VRTSIRTLSAVAAAVGLLTVVSIGSALGAGGRTFHLQLSGAAEPLGGDPNATGAASITINAGTQTLCYELSWSGVGGESEAADEVWGGHIHNAPAGVNGGIFVHLFGAPHEAATAYPGTFSVSDCMRVERELLVAILAHPGQYYLNIHNNEFPAGVIRAQLR
jgi:CHRD domain-containing protein